MKNYKKNQYADTVSIEVPGVGIVAKIVYRPDNPLSCGATCWIESDYDVKLDGEK